MKLVDPKFEELKYDNPLLLGERCTRVCYKSEHLAKEGSAKRLLHGIVTSGHTAMIEHISVYLSLTHDDFNNIDDIRISDILFSPYSKMSHDEKNVYVSTNLRVIYDCYPEMVDEFFDHDGERFTYANGILNNCKFEDSEYFLRRVTILFTMDRIGSQSFCRHRTFSFAQESTRWCNYIKDKFNNEICISTPCWLKDIDKEEFEEDMKYIESLYFKWISKGYKAEEARYFLPFGLKTEIIMTGFMDAWNNFFKLRDDSHAHIQAQELAKPLKEYFIKQGYIIS